MIVILKHVMNRYEDLTLLPRGETVTVTPVNLTGCSLYTQTG